jgi:tetratricopeptide (TPR) repeat protein
MRLAGAPLLVTAAIVASTMSPGMAATGELLEFRGRVVIPQEAVLRGRRITLTMIHVGTAFNARTRADSNGQFRFKKLPVGTYSLSIVVPGAGELRSTVDVTPTFADEMGRVERQFTYDKEALAREAQPLSHGMVSVRQLSIPRNARKEYSDARDDLRRQNVEGAWKHFQRAVEIAPQFTEALNYLGVLAYQSDDYALAETYFRQALDQDPETYEPLVNLGGVLLALGRPEEALEINRQAQSFQPEDPLANSQLGLSHYLLGNDQEALNFLLRTEQIDPAHFTNPQIPLANIYLRSSDEASAMQKLENFLDLHPDSPEADSVRAMLERIRDGQESETTATAIYD